MFVRQICNWKIPSEIVGCFHFAVIVTKLECRILKLVKETGQENVNFVSFLSFRNHFTVSSKNIQILEVILGLTLLFENGKKNGIIYGYSSTDVNTLRESYNESLE